MPAINTTPDHPSRTRNALMLTLAWLAVGIPLLWGVVQTIDKTLALFR
ncbi:MAG TPA: hypothetical protein VNO55_33000 [Polyangia bacterium]|nr:hypothetical protein [Polyangia bacterium]